MNEIIVDGDVARIQMFGGVEALIDVADIDLASTRHWCSVHREKDKTTYVQSPGRRPAKTITLHRLLLGFLEGQTVDHVNRNGLDNRRANLRIASQRQNLANRRPWSATGLKGVYLQPERWIARGREGDRRVMLGAFRTAEEAARAYDTWAKGHFGEFAYLNYPELVDTTKI